jgi:hypothetical protein
MYDPTEKTEAWIYDEAVSLRFRMSYPRTDYDLILACGMRVRDQAHMPVRKVYSLGRRGEPVEHAQVMRLRISSFSCLRRYPCENTGIGFRIRIA